MRLTLNSKPKPIPYHMRKLYKIFLILIIIKEVYPNGVKLLNLHFLYWNCKNPNKFDSLLEKFRKNDFSFNIDPNINKALELSINDGLVLYKKNSFKLTEKGEVFIREIFAKDLFLAERKFLKGVKKISRFKSNLREFLSKEVDEVVKN